MPVESCHDMVHHQDHNLRLLERQAALTLCGPPLIWRTTQLLLLKSMASQQDGYAGRAGSQVTCDLHLWEAGPNLLAFASMLS